VEQLDAYQGVAADSQSGRSSWLPIRVGQLTTYQGESWQPIKVRQLATYQGGAAIRAEQLVANQSGAADQGGAADSRSGWGN